MEIESVEPSDADLVEAAQQGRLDCFGALYQRYHNRQPQCQLHVSAHQGPGEVRSPAFRGNEADLERIRQGAGDITSPQDLAQQFLRGGGIKASRKLYVRGVTLSQDGQHARADCVRRESANSIVLTTPQWHFFDNDWWQVDD